MGDCALRFLSESLSLGIGLPLCLTPCVRGEDWERRGIGSNVNISFPWRLVVGDHVWMGDDVGTLSLAQVTIESNVCVARRSFLCTGSHDVRREDFKTKVAPILIRTGSWIAIGKPDSPWSNDWRGCGCFRWVGGFERCDGQLPRSRQPC